MMFQAIKRALHGVGLDVRRSGNVPFGVDKFADFKAFCPNPTVVFDVGANVGQTVQEVRSTLGGVKIYSFEPVPTTFKRLAENTRRDPNVECIPCALGESAGRASITDSQTSGQNTLNTAAKPDSPTVDVVVDTIDHFCTERKIFGIDLLKIDTEGYEPSVLRGARGMLEKGAISFVLAECEFTPNAAEPHGNFFEISSILQPFGYRVVAFYSGGVDGNGWRWGDVLFILPKIERSLICSPHA